MAGFGRTLLFILLAGFAGYFILFVLRLISYLIVPASYDYWLVGFLFDKEKSRWWKLKIVCIQIGILIAIAALWTILRVYILLPVSA